MALLDELDDWDAACGVLGDLDYEKQYIAIRALLRRQSRADAEIQREMEELTEYARRSTGWANERAIEEYGVSFYDSIFQGAAHSMAAVGMLAPFVESLFTQAFQGIRDQPRFGTALVTSHVRWSMPDDVRWNPRFAFPARLYVVDGIFELAEATGLATHLPSDLKPALVALFAYRNKMFHSGFEWPVEERRRFADRVAKEKWPSSWFETATTGGEPWVFYLSEDYISHLLQFVEAVLRGFGAFVRERVNDGIDPKASPWHPR
jgi:hypothetical protein